MLIYVSLLWSILLARVEELRDGEEQDRGASAIEWAIIAAVSVVIAVLIGGIVYNVVQTKGTELTNCAGQAGQPGAKC